MAFPTVRAPHLSSRTFGMLLQRLGEGRRLADAGAPCVAQLAFEMLDLLSETRREARFAGAASSCSPPRIPRVRPEQPRHPRRLAGRLRPQVSAKSVEAEQDRCTDQRNCHADRGSAHQECHHCSDSNQKPQRSQGSRAHSRLVAPSVPDVSPASVVTSAAVLRDQRQPRTQPQRRRASTAPIGDARHPSACRPKREDPARHPRVFPIPALREPRERRILRVSFLKVLQAH
jgi:hypothetical protein